MLQKNTFGQKKFKFHAPVQKCHFGKIEKLPMNLSKAWDAKLEAASFFAV